MPIYKAPIRDFEFVLNELLPLSHYADVPGFSEARGEFATAILSEGAKLCEEVLFPLNQVGDTQGLKYTDGKVTTPDGFKEAYQTYQQSGWPSFTCETDYGGQGLPEFLNMPIMEMVCSANLSFGLTPGLSHGAYNALHLHGSDALKKIYMPKLVTGEWAGVMCLTEPQAGTDLGLLRTQAAPQADGSHSITGTKIFISSGEQDMTENILHLVLARLPDAPKGSKGISLFLVSKYLVDDDGSLGAHNALHCAGIEHKMGLMASPTCVMNYDGAKGFLVGEPHKGLKAMFTMMNAARLYVGIQGLGIAEVAYQNALAYARERLQSRHIAGAKFPEKAADPIIVHGDVRRMLLTCRAFTEGARALAMVVAMKSDVAHRHPDASVREEADDFVQVATPIVKAYFTDMGFEVASTAMQIYGGYGYIREYGVEQYARDVRIAMIYEGTNGVQALDLVGRKLPYGTGKYLRSFFHPADAFVKANRGNEALAEFNKPLKTHLGYLQQATLLIAQQGLSNMDSAACGATEYLRMFSLTLFAWIWAQQADIALKALAAGTAEKEFYEDKLTTARFFMNKVLPQNIGLLASINAGGKAVGHVA